MLTAAQEWAFYVDEREYQMSNHKHYDATHNSEGKLTHEFDRDGLLVPVEIVPVNEITREEERQQSIDLWCERVQLADAVVKRYDGWGGDHVANATLMAGIIMAMSVSDVMDSLDKMNGETAQ